jgi:DNA-3-methyladenine glycosylase I
MNRCEWSTGNEMMIKYHDEEWGVPLHDDIKLFEFLILDAFQAGLNWLIILKKRENFRHAFDNYDIAKIAGYDTRKLKRLQADSGIVRNRLKIEAAVKNAGAFIEIRKEFGSFDKYIWQFVNGKTIHNNRQKLKEIPAKTREAENMSRDLKKRGFAFVGPTICYAFMQAAGLVNDHLTHCFRYEEIKKLA